MIVMLMVSATSFVIEDCEIDAQIPYESKNKTLDFCHFFLADSTSGQLFVYTSGVNKLQIYKIIVGDFTRLQTKKTREIK